MKRWLSVCLLLTASLHALDRAHFTELNKRGSEQAKQKDRKGLRETLLAIGAELPGPTPLYFLRMASVETHLGNTAAAIAWMRKYADMGLKYSVAADDDLKPLATESAFAAVEKTMAERTQPAQHAEAVCALSLADLMPEDLTFDKNSGSFVVSSIRRRGLFRVTLPATGSGECRVSEISLDADARRWPVLAVSADPTRNLLWMTSCAMPGFNGFPHEDEGKAALLAIDASTGKTVRRFELATGQPAVLGDMSLGRNDADAGAGTVYVSDSLGGGVYRVRGDLKTAALEKIGGDFFSPQTPALAADGKRLFVADYAIGVAVIDLAHANATGELNYLPHPDSVAVTGLDGMYLSGDSLIGIQNGTEPERIMRFRLNAAQTAIVSGEVVEQSTTRLGDPTHVIQVNGWFYVAANVGWDKVDDHGELKPGEHFTAPLLLRFREESPRLNHPHREKPPGRFF